MSLFVKVIPGALIVASLFAMLPRPDSLPVPPPIMPHLSPRMELSPPRTYAVVDPSTGDLIVHSASGIPILTVTVEAQNKLIDAGQRLDITSFNVKRLVRFQEGSAK